MTQYNQVELSFGVVSEVTDSSVYFEHVHMGRATALRYEEFEELYERVTRGEEGSFALTDEITVDVSEEFVHFVNDVFTTSVRREDLHAVYAFYEEIKSELQDPGRKVIFVWESEKRIAETRYASEGCVDTVVSELQSEYSEEYEIEVAPISSLGM